MCGQRLPGDRMIYCGGVLWKLTKAQHMLKLPLVPSVSSKLKLTHGAGLFHTSASCDRLTGGVGDLLTTEDQNKHIS